MNVIVKMKGGVVCPNMIVLISLFKYVICCTSYVVLTAVNKRINHSDLVNWPNVITDLRLLIR